MNRIRNIKYAGGMGHGRHLTGSWHCGIMACCAKFLNEWKKKMKFSEQHRRWSNKFEQDGWKHDIAAIEELKNLAERYPNHAATQEYYKKRLDELRVKYPHVKLC